MLGPLQCESPRYRRGRPGCAAPAHVWVCTCEGVCSCNAGAVRDMSVKRPALTGCSCVIRGPGA